MDQYSIDFGINRYFNAKALPKAPVFGDMKSISSPTPHIQNENILFLLVRSGSGIMIINQWEVELKRGVCACIGPFHNYTIIPNEGSILEISHVTVSNETYLYILSCPYMHVSEFLINDKPAISMFSEQDTRDAESLFDRFGLFDTSERNYYDSKLGFLAMMYLMGMQLHALEFPSSPSPYRRMSN